MNIFNYLVGGAISILCFVAWVIAIMHDLKGNLLMLILDILLPPFGVIRGFLLWVGA